MIIISGLPRSGTSLMCQLLESAGMKVANDGNRKPDEHNPYGYYEIKDPWTATDCDAVKIVIPQINKVFKKHKIILMQRGVESIAQSMGKMINEPVDIKILTNLRDQGQALIRRRFTDVLTIDFDLLVCGDRQPIIEIENFIGKEIDTRIIHTRN